MRKVDCKIYFWFNQTAALLHCPQADAFIELWKQQRPDSDSESESITGVRNSRQNRGEQGIPVVVFDHQFLASPWCPLKTDPRLLIGST